MLQNLTRTTTPLVLAAGLTAGLAAGTAQADPIDFSPTEAARVVKGDASPGGSAQDGEVGAKNAGTDKRTAKSWLKYDISTLTFTAGSASSLELTITGFSNENFDGDTFELEVFGMTDDSLDGWTPATMNWDNAPGNDTQDGFAASGPGVDPSLTTSLGSFSVVQDGTGNHGSFTISGQALADFINGGGNDTLTMILLSNTDKGIPGPDIDFDNSPTLTVTSVPEPASLALMGLGSMLMFVRQRRTAKA